MKNTQIGITKQSEWDQKWKDIFYHYQQDLRHAYYINAVLESADRKVLEIGAGSFRDMALLNKLEVDCWGTDYSGTSVGLAKAHFSHLRSKIFQSDAFDMFEVADNEFDVSFHNGLWVLFNDDTDVLKLAKEQARISRNKIIATVHNGHNKKFVKYFHKLSQNDPLYKIRFYTMDEIQSLMLSVCSRVKIVPVGKGKKHFEDDMINRAIVGRLELSRYFEDVGLKCLENSERLLCIGYM